MRERRLFLEALKLTDKKELDTFLQQECGNDAALRKRTEQLLQCAGQMGDFLASPVLDPNLLSPISPQTTTVHFCGATTDPGSMTDGITGSAECDSELSLLATLASLRPFLTTSESPGSLGRLLHYDVMDIVGQGAFGIVLMGKDTKLERLVAIKVLLPSLAVTSAPRQRFVREARSAASIRHENVVSIYGIEEEPIPFLVMEFINGKNLQERIDEAGSLELNEVFPLARQLLAGLEAAHSAGIIHRDIKPSNILVEEGGRPRVKITDFGLARTVDDARLTLTGNVAGTPMYMSPEQAQGQSLDARSDLFSVGSVLYMMLTGRPPFRAPATLAVLKRVVDDVPRPIEQIAPEVPEWVREIIGRLHAKKATARFQSASEARVLWDECESRWQCGESITLELQSRLLPAPDSIVANPLDRPTLALPRSRIADRVWPLTAIACLLLLGAYFAAVHFFNLGNEVAKVSVGVSRPIETGVLNNSESDVGTRETDGQNLLSQSNVTRSIQHRDNIQKSLIPNVATVPPLHCRIVRGASRERFLAWAQELGQGFIPHSINPRHGSDPGIVDAVATVNTAKSPWLIHDVTDSEADFQQMWRTHRPAWRMQVLNGSGNPPRTLFLWVADIPFWRTFMGSRIDIHSHANEMSVENFFPSSLFGCLSQSGESWTLTQAPLPDAKFQTFPDLNTKDLEFQLENFRERGWMPIRLMQHVGFDEPRFAVVFRDSQQALWGHSANLSDHDFERLLEEYQSKGMWPAIIASSLSKDVLRYRVIWTKLLDPQ
jgi:serine/threonine protein kinase